MESQSQPLLSSEDGQVITINRKRNALARTLKPDYLGIDPAVHTAGITDVMRQAVEPDQLIRSLVDISADSPAAVSYTPGGSRRSGYIALTPREYTIIPRNVEALEHAVRNTTLAARPRGDAHTEAADRSVLYTLESKYNSSTAYTQDILNRWNGLLVRFAMAAKHPGLSLMGPEDSMRIQFGTFKEDVLGNMLDALRVQRNWNDEQYDFARRTIETRMFIDRERNKHIAYFAGFIAMSQLYFGHKTALFKDRIYQTSREIRKLNVS